jgi:hypothetical protein
VHALHDIVANRQLGGARAVSLAPAVRCTAEHC